MKILIYLGIFIPFFLIPNSTKELKEDLIIYNFRDSVNKRVNEIYENEFEVLRKENVDSNNNYKFYIFLDQSVNCKNKIYIDYVDSRSDFYKYVLASKIFFQLKSNEMIPIVTNYDIAFNQNYQTAKDIIKVTIFDGRTILFDNNGDLTN